MSGEDELSLLAGKNYDEPSEFIAENLMREARRQRGLGDSPVPDVCLLDPDGDVVTHLRRSGDAVRHPDWACYHTELWTTKVDGREIGIVACAVGAPFAVLVAEQLAASGCSLVSSVSSAGAIVALGDLPHFMVIHAALYAYAAASDRDVVCIAHLTNTMVHHRRRLRQRCRRRNPAHPRPGRRSRPPAATIGLILPVSHPHLVSIGWAGVSRRNEALAVFPPGESTAEVVERGSSAPCRRRLRAVFGVTAVVGGLS